MPELPEVETVCRGLASIMVGQTLERVDLKRSDLRFPLPKNLCKTLEGQSIRAIKRRAKYILIIFGNGNVLICHLGMSGTFKIYSDTQCRLKQHDHVIFLLSGKYEIRYNDPRRFGFMLLSNLKKIRHHHMLYKLGPEPINPNISGPMLEERLKGRSGSIKTVLLNQSVIAGLGNIYVCESLNLAGVSPKRMAKNVTGQRAEKLAKAIVYILNTAINVGGSSINDHKTPEGGLGYFQMQFRVYGKEGYVCSKCSDKFVIKKITQSNRSTFYCSNCQR